METLVPMRPCNDYIDDPYFMKWIFQPDESTVKYWENYIEKFPNEKKLILAIQEELRQLELKNKNISDRDKRLLFQKIVKNKVRHAAPTWLRYYGTKILSYAAIALLFLLVGNILMYLYLDGHSGEKQINYAALEYTYPTNESTLILSDGTGISLKKNSVVEYSSKERKVIVDNRNVPITSSNSVEPALNQLIIPSGNRAKVILNDNTTVHLNAGSKLIYPSFFDNNMREVVLFGEAFFEVTKNAHKPFVVKTPFVDIEVLGTRFNVSAYSKDNQIQTVLVEGKVSVRNHDASVFDRKVLLNPNQILVFNKQTKQMDIKNVDIEYYTLWKDRVLKFEDEELNLIAEKIERFYDLEILLDDPSKGKMKISGKLNLSEENAEVFNYLSVLTKMNFEKIGEKTFLLK